MITSKFYLDQIAERLDEYIRYHKKPIFYKWFLLYPDYSKVEECKAKLEAVKLIKNHIECEQIHDCNQSPPPGFGRTVTPTK